MNFIPLKNNSKHKVYHSFEDGYFENHWLTRIIGLSMGVLIIVFVIWNRAIRERLPRDLTLMQTYSIEFWLILFSFLLSFIWTVYYTNEFRKKLLGLRGFKKYGIYWKILNFLEKQPDNPSLMGRLITKVFIHSYYWLKFLKNYVLGAPLYLWRYCHYNQTPYNLMYTIVCFFLDRYYVLRKLYHSKMELNIIMFKILLTTVIFYYIPRLVAFSVFMFEILVYKKLDFFYYVAPIFLVSLGFTSVRRLLFDISERELMLLQTEDKLIRITRVISEYPDVKLEYENCRPDLSEEDEIFGRNAVYDSFVVLEMMKRFYIVDKEETLVVGCKLLISLILSISLGIWVGIILGWY